MGCAKFVGLVAVVVALAAGYINQHHKEVFSAFWGLLSPSVDANIAPIKAQLFSDVKGRVLEIGCGFGTTFKYLNSKRITSYTCVEPNWAMHEQLKAAAADVPNFVVLNGTAQQLQVWFYILNQILVSVQVDPARIFNFVYAPCCSAVC
jgi:hypothetical protein